MSNVLSELDFDEMAGFRAPMAKATALAPALPGLLKLGMAELSCLKDTLFHFAGHHDEHG